MTRSGKSGLFFSILHPFYTNLYLSSDIHIVVVNIKLDWKKFSFVCIHFVLFCCLVCNIFEMNNVQFDVSMWYCDTLKDLLLKMVMYIANVPLGSVKVTPHWLNPFCPIFFENTHINYKTKLIYQLLVIWSNQMAISSITLRFILTKFAGIILNKY